MKRIEKYNPKIRKQHDLQSQPQILIQELVQPCIWFGNLMLSSSPLPRSISTRASEKKQFPLIKDAMI